MSGALAALGGLGGALAGALSSGGSGWRGSLRRASFRGVEFHFDQASGTYGRRYAMHEYPGRDIPFAEDLGRKQREWTFNGYTIGSSFHNTRSALLKACEEAGPGSLILPLLGRVEAVCTSIDFSDSRMMGGYSALSISFAEAGERQAPEGAGDTRSQIGTAALGLTDAQRSTFLGTAGTTGFSVGAGQSFVAAAAAGDVAALAGQLDQLRLPSFDYDQAPLAAAIDVLGRQASSLVYYPDRLFDAVDEAFAAYTDGNTADTAFAGMLTFASGFFAHEVTPFPNMEAEVERYRTLRPRTGTDPAAPRTVRDAYARVAEALNAALFQSLVHRLALREIGYALPGIDLDNTERAETVRDQIFAVFLIEGDVAATSHDDDAFAALAGLAYRILDDLDNRAAQLPSLSVYRTPRSINAITLAHQLYGDAERNLELVDRVGAFSPAFMPLAGRVLDR